MDTARRLFLWLFSSEYGARDWLIARWLFLRALGAIYFSAFFALLFQVKGLIGTNGLMPAAEYLEAGRRLGLLRFWAAPTLLWISSGDHMLMAVMWAGLIASVLLVLNVWPRAMLVVCFLCYLSFVGVGQEFANYQSDGMLLEAGFISLFLAPPGLLPGWGARRPPMRAAILLLLWEWFRIYFESGVVKLASGDPTWRNLTAMYEYYQNGPLPTWVGWYAEQMLPQGFQKFAAGATLFLELVLVWMVLLPRPFRIALAVIVTVWQAGVIATANYAFLNYLVLVLGVLLVDDRALVRFVPKRWRGGLVDPDGPVRSLTLREVFDADVEPALSVTSPAPETRPPVESVPATRPLGRFAPVRLALAGIMLTWIAYATTVPMFRMFWRDLPLPSGPISALEPFRIANEYGLFAVMTPHRYEIEFQGSNDGQNWKPYLFRYKPQNLYERPRIYAPYQPRFDWNLWFASLGPWMQDELVPVTEEKLLENDREVLGLFRGNPFPDAPPKYVRAVLYQYWFSNPAQRNLLGQWWVSQLLGTYAPTLERKPDGKFGIVDEPTLPGPPQSTS